MKLGEILDLLVSSELANLAYVENNQIVESKIPNIVNAINLGLIKLYTRFKLRKDYLFLNVSSTIDTYELITSKTVSGNNVGAYILDTDKPYTGNLLEVLTVVSSDGVGYNLDGSDGLCLLKTNTLIKTSIANIHSPEIKIIADYLGQSPESMLVNRDLYTKKQGAINSVVSRYEQMDDLRSDWLHGRLNCGALPH